MIASCNLYDLPYTVRAILPKSLFHTSARRVYFLQVLGVNNKSIGKISSLPASMSNIMTSFDKSENELKLPIGPTRSSPGPMLFKVAATAVKVDVKSKLSKDTSKTEIANINIYVTKKTLVERITS